jgi:SAM-dependent methyltransferase
MNEDLALKSPAYDKGTLHLSRDLSQQTLSIQGAVCSMYGDEYPIVDSIIDLLKDQSSDYSLAEWSNQFNLTAAVYEDLWRVNSLKLISGEPFNLDEELALLIDWIKPEQHQRIIDIGSSTAVYARAIAKACPEATIAALDFSMPMLKEAKHRVAKEQQSIYLIRVNVSELPFFNNEVDTIVCGGSLNEFSDPLKVLFECRRVLSKGGHLFMMHLLKAETVAGKLLQTVAGNGGLQFWTKSESNALFERAGFSIDRQMTKGIVCFSLLKV